MSVMQINWRSLVVITLAVVLLSTATGCEDKTGTAASPSPSASASAAPSPNAQGEKEYTPDEVAKQLNLPLLTGKATVQLTVQGQPITIELDGANAPVTAGNFVDLIEKKFYDGLVFHRVVKEPTPFVAQGGDPAGKDPNVPVTSLGGGGYVDPATKQERNVPLEIRAQGAKDIVYGRTFSMDPKWQGKKPQLRHTRGAVAMARSQNPNSASSQFYITLADQSFLDGEYAVFGYVKEGMEAVDKIKQGDRIDSFRVLQMDQGAFKTPAAAPAGAPSPTPSASPSPGQ
jgi:peptidyl-prolyl cis-trans isomerase B (cyclophilin B)